MTEVKTSSAGGQELFATKDYAVGDIIVEEEPILRVAPSTSDEVEELLNRWNESKVASAKSSTKALDALLQKIEPPADVATQAGDKFRFMVQVGVCSLVNAGIDGEVYDRVSQLYHPSFEVADTAHKITPQEQSLVDLSGQVITYMKDHFAQQADSIDGEKKDAVPTDDQWKRIRTIMLVWACNAFDGGRIYDTISRINHACNPNAVIVATGNRQKVVAAAPVASGDAITISYLGMMLYSDTATRRQQLRATKYFECGCDRCSSPDDDMADQIPCPSAHPRPSSHLLDEDVQYDDEQTVQYVVAGTAYANGDVAKLQAMGKSVAAKIAKYLEQYNPGLGLTQGKDADSDNNSNNDDEVLEEYLSLANSTMGDRHWTTNLLRLLHVNQHLSQLSQMMLTTQELPEMEDIAEIIDSVERICRFVSGMKLKLHMGHLLSDVIIGVARMLVSLGDVKSQKYGAEWLRRIDDGEHSYVEHFETDGRQKVVQTLKDAWKKHHGADATQDGDDGRDAKRVKTS